MKAEVWFTVEGQIIGEKRLIDLDRYDAHTVRASTPGGMCITGYQSLNVEIRIVK